MLLDNLLHSKILIVDDDVSNIQLLSDILRFNGFKDIKTAHDPRGVISLFIEFEPDIVLLDLNMPHISGFELLRMMQPLIGDSDYLPILVISAEEGYEVRRQVLTDGASDFLSKPYIAEEVCIRVSNMLRIRHRNLELQAQIRQRSEELARYQLDLKEAQLETILRLARAAEHRDDDTGRHTQRVGLLCSLLAQSLGWPEHDVQLLQYAAPLHDVGKIGIPDSILLKPGPFTEAERKIMQRHAKIGSSLLAGGHSEIVRMAERIALTHHERWDGTGYPNGLQGEQIDLPGRILAIADVFDALTHARPYKQAWPLEDALTEIKNQRGKHFDPQLVDCFLAQPVEELQRICA
ncbi:MAG TPA: HD domain-containing phosphohydrolase [Abditibacteriaceae bacterium]|jgi:putative two-component system response regulator